MISICTVVILVPMKLSFFLQVSPMPEQNISGPGGLHGHPPTTIPMFLKSKHNKGDGCT